MGELTNQKEVGGDAIHVRDCYVWAEIYYLDSPTDFREYLPQTRFQQLAASGNNLIMTGSRNPAQLSTGSLVPNWRAIIFFMMVGLFFYCLLR